MTVPYLLIAISYLDEHHNNSAMYDITGLGG